MDNFDWNNFLEQEKSVAVPEELFSHVEQSLHNGIKKGMLLEVCHSSNPDIHWIGEITMVCSHLIRVKFIGSKDEFWCDLLNTKVHPLGWCAKYEEQLEPPEELFLKNGDTIIDMMKQILYDGTSVSLEDLDIKGMSPIDRIKAGMKVEVQNITDPYKYWIATICENTGGRLLLQYDGADDDINKFWIFYSNPRLCGFGFVTNKGSPWQFKYPGKVNKFLCKNKLSSLLRQCAEEAIKEPTPSDLFQSNVKMESHNFVYGMKLEALDPRTMDAIRPATVIKVFSNFHFLVVIDDHVDDYELTRMVWLCNSTHPYIYPIGWAQKHSVPFKPPSIWDSNTFDWDDYLSMTSSVPAPEYCFGRKEHAKGIQANMKLEAVNPRSNDEIHIANVCAVTEHMLCVELLPIGEKCWYHHKSDLLYPVGWCDSNNYELHIPDVNAINKEPHVEHKKVEEKKTTEEWCDRIYFNYKCYSGPMISRNKLSQLPKHVGPGPLSLVLKEVMNKIISASYKPAKLLKDWEVNSPPEEGMKLEVLKAKLKSSTYRACVPVATTAAQVSLYCREYCVKLQACPFMFGPIEFKNQCPETCQMVDKSKFQSGAERRGRPKGCVSGRKKKKKGTSPPERPKEQPASREAETTKEGADSANESEQSASTPPSEQGTRPNSPDSGSDSRNRKRKAEQIENSKMKTRGAKLPNFAVQMKESHWDRKDVETIYNNSCATKKHSSQDSDTDIGSSQSSNSREIKRISDVSDSEEPELKKLKFGSDDSNPTDSNMFDKNAIMSWFRGDLKLSPNPVDWSVDDVYLYLSNTEDCKLIADKMKQEQIDGQAFIMLDLSIIRDFLHMKPEFARQLCKHIARIRCYYIDASDDGAD